MTSLDKALRDILIEYSNSLILSDYVPVELESQTIEAIKNCFKEEGFRTYTKITQEDGKTVAESGLKLMSGTEWRQAFERELDKQFHAYDIEPPDAERMFHYDEVLEVAKRASGEDND